MVKFFYTKLFKEKKKTRGFAILLAYLVAILLLVLLAWLVIPADRGQHRHAVYELPKLHTQRTGYAGHGSGALRR